MFTAASLLLTQAAIHLASLAGFDAAADSAAPKCGGKHATIVGTSRAEVITGTPGNDVIAALRGNDVIYGRGGNDVICGGPGSDKLFGGRGNDRLYGGLDRIYSDEEGTERAGDTLVGGPGNDRLDPGRDTRPADEIDSEVISWADSPRGVHIDVAKGTATGDGRDTFVAHHTHILGSRHADVIRGGAGPDYLDGSFGRDTLVGRGGDDLLVTDDISQVERGSADIAYGGPGNDSLIAYGGRDQLFGGAGNDQVQDFGDSSDVLYGGPGADVVYDELSAKPGGQVLSGGTGPHDELVLFGNKINSSGAAAHGTWNMATGAVSFASGTAHITGSATGLERLTLNTWGTSWTITGTDGPDAVMASGSTGTRFYALGGDDVFDGSYYDDLFDGGTGSDTAISMGHGTDTCRNVERFDMVLGEQDCESIS